MSHLTVVAPPPSADTPPLLSPLPSPVPESPSISTEINIATRLVHTRLNKLITTRLALALPPYSTSPKLYAQGINTFGEIYLVFENCWQFRSNDTQGKARAGEVGEWSQHEREVRQWLCDLVPSGLWRSQDVQDDVETLETLTGLDLDVAQSPELLAFTEHIYKITKEKPHVLVAYAWIMYMAVFSGGRWIRQQLIDAGPAFWGFHTESEQLNFDLGRDATQGFLIFFFEGRQDGEDIKADFKRRLERAEELLTPEERSDIVSEAQIIFEHCISIVEGLDKQLDTQSQLSKIEQAKADATLRSATRTSSTWSLGLLLASISVALLSFFVWLWINTR